VYQEVSLILLEFLLKVSFSGILMIFVSPSRGAGVCDEMSSEGKTKARPHLSVWALISFIFAFVITRTFTSVYPTVIWQTGGFHVHHFWYGLAMLAAGGWLGISVENERINRVAAILFGAGGGLIGDEVGLLLTLEGENYWAEMSYTIMIVFVAFMAILILLSRYYEVIRAEFVEFSRRNASLYFGVFLGAVSVAFLLETGNLMLITVLSVLAMTALLIILAYFLHRINVRHRSARSVVNCCEFAGAMVRYVMMWGLDRLIVDPPGRFFPRFFVRFLRGSPFDSTLI
jgi:hypothetical protein